MLSDTIDGISFIEINDLFLLNDASATGSFFKNSINFLCDLSRTNFALVFGPKPLLTGGILSLESPHQNLEK